MARAWLIVAAASACATACVAPKIAPLDARELPEDVRWLGLITVAEDGAILESTGLVEREADLPAYLSFSSADATFFAVGYSDAQLRRHAPERTREELFAGKLRAAEPDRPALPAPIWSSHFLLEDGEPRALDPATPPDLRTEWLECAPPDEREIFVDARTAIAGQTGSADCPAKTITAGLAIARARGANTVRVASGLYDAALGETFPLEVRGVSLLGAGAEETVIRGQGLIDLASRGGPILVPFAVSMMAGDNNAPTEIADLTLVSTATGTQNEPTGIYCDAGNASYELAGYPPPNTTLRNIHAGQGFMHIVYSTTHTVPEDGGCNLAVSNSTLSQGHDGVFSLGCGTGNPGRVPSAVRVEDSTFIDLTVAVRVWDCSRFNVVRDSRFYGGDYGVAVEQRPEADGSHNRFQISGNLFQEQGVAGLLLFRSVEVQDLSDNIFRGIRKLAGSIEKTAALRLISRSEVGAPANNKFPRLRARRNLFTGNDAGLTFDFIIDDQAPIPVAINTAIDFGRPGDPGQNVFACNRTLDGSAERGFDVGVLMEGDGGGEILLAGNAWDHAPPTRALFGDAPNGIDLMAPADTVSIDVSGAIIAGQPCP